MRPYAHPITQMHHGQQLGFLKDIQEWGQDIIDKNINEPAQEFLTDTIGLSQEEVDKINAEVNKEIQKTTQNELNNLIAQVTGQGGSGGATTAPSTVAQVQTQITNAGQKFYQELMKGNPMYIAGAALGGGLVLYGLYSVVAGPRTA